MVGLNHPLSVVPFFSKVIYTTVKVITPEELEWYTEDCLALKKEFPDLIAGSCHYPTSTD